MVSGVVTVPSVYGQNYHFTVNGTNTLAYAEKFANVLDAALAGGTLAYSNLSQPGASIPGYTENGALGATAYEQEISQGGDYILPDTTPGALTFVSANGSSQITGSGIGDNLLVYGAGNSSTYYDVGGNNLITFVDGNNIYWGDTVSSAGTDTIVGGSGNDTISTGAGKAFVYAGTGDGLIGLNDTLPAGATADVTSTDPADYNQFVYLDDGQNTVFANGVADVVIATAPGQTIVGGLSTTQTDLFALVAPGSDGNFPPADAMDTTAPVAGIPMGNDQVFAAGAQVSVYDATDGNSIYGGSGSLVVLFADSVQSYVNAGTGSNVLYGANADTISYTAGSGNTGIFVLGSGAESVDASGAAGQLTFVLGTGNDTLTAGTNTTFNANYDSATGLTGNITINDFAGNDNFDFVGYTEDQYNAALATGTQTATGYQITLSDNTTVTFVGVTSITGHTTNT